MKRFFREIRESFIWMLIWLLLWETGHKEGYLAFIFCGAWILRFWVGPIIRHSFEESWKEEEKFREAMRNGGVQVGPPPPPETYHAPHVHPHHIETPYQGLPKPLV
jgi:hypothetical protein